MATPLRERLLGRFAGLTNRFRSGTGFPSCSRCRPSSVIASTCASRTSPIPRRDPSLLEPSTGGNGHDQRQADGSYNDLGCPWMGMAGARFGRNVPIGDTHGEQPPELYEPNPRQVSRDLLARRSFVPVPHLNVLVPAWLQFMVHDWLSHGGGDTTNAAAPVAAAVRRRLAVSRHDDPAHAAGRPVLPGGPGPTRDLSQHRDPLVGRLADLRIRPRAATRWCAPIRRAGSCVADGKIHLDAQGHLPVDATSDVPNLELSGVNGSWWVGLSVLHTLFAREHNAIVDRLRVDYPTADGEWLFQKARLVNAALIAKIHTVEWTPALMNSPEGRMAMRGNFWGLLGEHYARAYGRLGDGEILSGIPGSPPITTPRLTP